MSRVTLKQFIFAVIRYTGFYRLARRLYRKKLLILCYHGVSVKDEHEWWPGVFMEKTKFQSRMALVKSMGFTPMALGDAVTALQAGTLPSYPLVITADDGYLNSPETFASICKELDLPLTIYVTSYHAEKQSPIFNVAIQYLFWKSVESWLKGPFPTYFGHRSNDAEVYLDARLKNEWAQRIIDHGRENLDDSGRTRLIEDVAGVLGIDYSALERAGAFRLMGSEGVRKACQLGTDIQLHTHRHQFPVDREVALREIEENRHYLEPLSGKKLNHFCYPSGVWDRQQWEWLESLGIKSATTCNIGFNDSNTPLLALNRYLDSNTITTNEFIAEISGASDFIRSVIAKFRFDR